MILKKKISAFALFTFLTFLSYQNGFAQCFEIGSILVDACGPGEGFNEMVRFKVGGVSLNTSNLSVDWPNNPWQGLIQDATTASKTASLNADILDAGGCGQLIEPTGGLLPANASVILVTSYILDTALNSFGALSENIYILYQNNSTAVSGHFANSGTGLRTLTINFSACSDTVTYDRNLLVSPTGATVPADGAIVEFNAAGIATYINNGCSAPVQPFTVDAGPVSLNACAGSTVALNGNATGQSSVNWTAETGTFLDSTALSTNYSISATATGTITLTLTATDICGLEVTDTININIISPLTPNFITPLAICSGTTAPVLNTTSPNGITGTWSPDTVSNTTSGAYIFTPNEGQCAEPFTLNVDVSSTITPNFTTPLTICSGSTAPILNTTSPNGITGTWSPATVSNTATADYIFTPDAGQCAVPFTLRVDVNSEIIPDFTTPLTICIGATAPILNSTSPNGITGTWSPDIVSNTATADYIFTPDAGQCAVPFTLQVNVNSEIIPNFTTPLAICSGAAAPILNTTSPNGITGTWSPDTISNTATADYIFTPDAGQCAVPFTLQVNVDAEIIPNFATPLAICSGDSAPVLNNTSPNGVTGTWSPATVSNTVSADYIFTPDAGQCAVPFTLQVDVNSIVPDFTTTLTLCNGEAAPFLNTVAPNGITGTWNPTTINSTAGGIYVFTPDAGQCSEAVTLTVTISSILFELNQGCVNGQYLLEVLPVTASFELDEVDYTWINSQGTTVGTERTLNVSDLVFSNPSLQFPAIFQIVLSNDQGCTTAPQSITVSSTFCQIPKGISPNNDNMNDTFDLTGLGVQEISIFNRYGTTVYTQRNYSNQWGGQSNDGHELPDATYFYVIVKENLETITGWVYINR